MERGVWEREPNEIRMCDVRMSGLGPLLSLALFASLFVFSLIFFLYLSQFIFLSSQMVCFLYHPASQLNVLGLVFFTSCRATSGVQKKKIILVVCA